MQPLIDFDEGVPDVPPREVGLALHHCPAVRLEPLRLEVQQHDSNSTRTVPNLTGVSRRTKQCAVYVVHPHWTLRKGKQSAKKRHAALLRSAISQLSTTWGQPPSAVP